MGSPRTPGVPGKLALVTGPPSPAQPRRRPPRVTGWLSGLSQLVRYSAEGLLQLGPLGSTSFLPDSKCLVDDGRTRTPALKKCEDVARPAQRLWDFTQVSGPLRSARGWELRAVGGLNQLLPREPHLTEVRWLARVMARKGQ